MSNLINLTSVSFAPEQIQLLVNQLSGLITLFQAIGGAFILWIVISLIRMYTLRKRNKLIEEISKDLKELKENISALGKRKR